MTAVQQLGSANYVLLTTFRRDGRAVATPLWVVPDGAGLAVWTPKDTGKVKRIRNSGRVTVAACDFRGNVSGETIEAQAKIGNPDDRVRVGRELARKYGLIGRITLVGSRIRRGLHGTIAILIS